MRYRLGDWSLGRLRLGRVCELYGPITRILTRVDFEEPGPVEASDEAIVAAVDLKLPIARAHEGFAFPFAAAFIHGVSVIELRCKRSPDESFAGAGFDIPPAFAHPGLAIGVSDRNGNPVTGIVAKAKVGARGPHRGEKSRGRQEIKGL